MADTVAFGRLFIAVWMLAAVTDISADKHSYRNFKLIRIHPDSDASLTYLRSLYEAQSPYALDFWQPPTHVGAVVDLAVAPAEASALARDLTARGIHYIVAINDLQRAIESERAVPYPFLLSPVAAHPPRGFSYERYNSLDDIYAELKRLRRERPKLVTLFDIGQTYENRTLLVVKIGGSREPPPESGEGASIWIDAGIHAREWIAPATALYIIRELIQGYDDDPSLQALLDHSPFYILPIMNPDGYEYSRTQDRMWRKNRRAAECTQKEWYTVCCRGVDLNRNFDWFWAASGSSSDSCHDTYHGPSAFSEPESVAVRDFLEAYPPKAFISLHSYSQMWLIPYGHRRRSYPSDYSSALRPLALKATKALESVYGTKYQVGTGADLMYEASGASHDWAKGALKVPFAYLVELRPRNTLFGNGFLVPEREIIPTGKETWAAVRVVAEEVFAHFAQPAIRSASVSSTTTTEKPFMTTSTTPRPIMRQRLRFTTPRVETTTTSPAHSPPPTEATPPPSTPSPSPSPPPPPPPPAPPLPIYLTRPPPPPPAPLPSVLPPIVVPLLPVMPAFPSSSGSPAEESSTTSTLATVRCEDYGSYCRLWHALNLCDRRAVSKLCTRSCNAQCRV